VPGVNSETITYYGRLQHILSITLPDSCQYLQPSEQTNSIFAFVHRCNLKPDDSRLACLDIHFFSKEKETFEVIDVTGVQCLVGRVKAGKNLWAIIDRSGKLARATCEESGHQSD